MKKTNLFTIALSVFILASCATSSDVVDGGLFQKRKYNKGFHIHKTSKVATPKTVENEVEMANVFIEDKVSNENNSKKETTSTVIEKVHKSNVEEVVYVNENNISETNIKNNEVELAESKKVENEENQNFKTNFRTTSLRKKSIFSDRITSTSFDKSETSQIMADTILLVIIAIFIPFLAVGLYEGITTRFWISLLLTILLFFPGLIYAILVVTGTI